MKDHARVFPRLVSVLVLTLTLICSFACFTPDNRLRAVAAQSTPPSGSFGFLIDASSSDPSNEYGFAILGVMNFDGAGERYRVLYFRSGSRLQARFETHSRALTGTYSSNPDGTGSVTITDDTGTTFTFAMVITDSGQGLQLVATNCSGGCNIGGTTLISGVARAAHPGPLRAPTDSRSTIRRKRLEPS